MNSAIKRDTGWMNVKTKDGTRRVTVTVEADFAKIMHKLATKAANSRRGMATAMHGAIVVRTSNEPQQDGPNDPPRYGPY